MISEAHQHDAFVFFLCQRHNFSEIVLERQLGPDVPAKLHRVIAGVVTGQIPGQAESVPHAIARVHQRERQSRAGEDRMVVEIIDMFVSHVCE